MKFDFDTPEIGTYIAVTITFLSLFVAIYGLASYASGEEKMNDYLIIEQNGKVDTVRVIKKIYK